MLEEELEAGRRQWTIAWRRFARQWTQPQLLKLADAVMGGRYLHSSQISGFATGKLREPAPKVFVVIGRLNQALATGGLPPEVKELGAGKQVLKDKDGQTLDSVGCFRAFTGQVELEASNTEELTEDELEAANKRLGRHLRSQFMTAGIDFIEEFPRIKKNGINHLQSVLLGKKLSNDDLKVAMTLAAKLLQEVGVGSSVDHLWKIATRENREKPGRDKCLTESNPSNSLREENPREKKPGIKEPKI